MSEPSVLVVDDRRSPSFPHVIARRADEALAVLCAVVGRGLDQLWLDYDLGNDRFGIQRTTWDIVLALTDPNSDLFRVPIAEVFVHTADVRASERVRRRLAAAAYVVNFRPLPL